MSLKDSLARLIKQDIFEALLESEMDEQQAARLAASIFTKIQHKRGGSEVFIPKLFSEERWQHIRDAFTGDNHAQVCRQYGISLRTLYRVLNG